MLMAMTALAYLFQEFKGKSGGSFSKEWGKLTEKDKRDLREAADKEMTVMGIKVSGIEVKDV